MPASPTPPLQLSLNPSSAASSGDDLFRSPFKVQFGNKAAGQGSSASGNPPAGGNTWISGLVKDVAVGLVVAIAARYAWREITK